MNVRFWQYLRGWVKITLKPGQSLHWSRGGPTEEGWYRDSHTWTYRNDGIVKDAYVHDGADCDGRLTHTGEMFFLDTDANALDSECSPSGKCPKWLHGKRRQRDYSAEAMGY